MPVITTLRMAVEWNKGKNGRGGPPADGRRAPRRGGN